MLSFSCCEEDFNTLNIWTSYARDPDQEVLARQINEIIRIFKNTFNKVQKLRNVYENEFGLKMIFPTNVHACVTVCGRLLENLTCIDLKVI